MEGLPMAQLPFLKKYSIKCERFRLWIVLFWTKTSLVLHYIHYLATDNIHIVLENDNTVLKGLKKVVSIWGYPEITRLFETSYDRLKSRETAFQQYRENLAKAIFPMGYKYPWT